MGPARVLMRSRRRRGLRGPEVGSASRAAAREAEQIAARFGPGRAARGEDGTARNAAARVGPGAASAWSAAAQQRRTRGSARTTARRRKDRNLSF